MRIIGKLDIAFSDDTEVSDRLQCYISELLVVTVGEGLARCDDDTLACMDSHRVDVLHIAHCDTGIMRITDNLVLEFLPSHETLVDDDLMGIGEGLLEECEELLSCVSKSTSESSEGKSRSHENWVSDHLCNFHCFVDRFRCRTSSIDDTDCIKGCIEPLSIFSDSDRLSRCPEDGDIVFLEDTSILELESTVQGCLSTE